MEFQQAKTKDRQGESTQLTTILEQKGGGSRPAGRPLSQQRVVEYSNCCTYAEIELFVNETARTAVSEAHHIITDNIVNAILEHPHELTEEKIVAPEGEANAL